MSLRVTHQYPVQDARVPAWELDLEVIDTLDQPPTVVVSIHAPILTAASSIHRSERLCSSSPEWAKASSTK